MTRPSFDLRLETLLPLALRTVRAPRDVATYLTSLGFSANALWMMIATVIVVSVLIGQLATLLLVPPGQQGDAGLISNPLVMLVSQGVFVIVAAYAIYWIGGLMGGTGSLNDTLTVLAWLEFIMVVLKVVQIGVLLVSPLLAALVYLATVLLVVWLLVNFIAVVHGFDNLVLVFLMTFVSALVITFGLSIVLAALGVPLEDFVIV